MSSDKYPHLGFDPAPGDLETVRLLVAAVGKVSRDGGTAQTQLGKIGTSDGIWVGKSADAFTDSVSKIPPYLKKALDSLGDAHRALASWETSLDGFQARARKLEEEAATAAKQVSSAKTSLTGLPENTSGMSKKELEKDKKGKEKAVDTADAELEAIRNRAHTLNTEYNTAAGSVARTVRNAADDAPPEPGWFDDLVDAVSEFVSDAWDTLTDPNFWKLVGDLLADIAMVIGVICLFAIPFGGIAGLAMIGLIVGAGALASHGIALAGGAEGVTWQTLAWDAAGVFAGGVGLAGARLAQAGRALVQSGRTLRATQGFAATLGKIGPGNWGGIAQIPSGVANSARGFATAAKGWTHVAAGNALDWGATFAGAAFAGGSNMNDGRWTDGDWNISDMPIVGPGKGFADYFGAPDETQTVAPGPLGPQVDAPTTLTSSGSSFTNGLNPSQYGTAA
ncbi:putative T7SS-secreted protein [Streptomyces sp. NPDC048845]|uniref:putative T7SS-secreted protein n=1 Tax=Streptomyces sp. NPDC048845 TaxID=3155390 RepID=UPI0034234A55